MNYKNPDTGLTIDLSNLTDEEAKFYQQASKKLKQNADWLAFDEFAFSMSSPIYRGRRSHQDVSQAPLFLALKDMSLRLGLQQGRIARSKTQANA